MLRRRITVAQSFYVRLCNGVHEKNQHYVVIKDVMVVMKEFYKVIIFVIQAFMMQKPIFVTKLC